MGLDAAAHIRDPKRPASLNPKFGLLRQPFGRSLTIAAAAQRRATAD
jgi:hypothetical protein